MNREEAWQTVRRFAIGTYGERLDAERAVGYPGNHSIPAHEQFAEFFKWVKANGKEDELAAHFGITIDPPEEAPMTPVTIPVPAVPDRRTRTFEVPVDKRLEAHAALDHFLDLQPTSSFVVEGQDGTVIWFTAQRP